MKRTLAMVPLVLLVVALGACAPAGKPTEGGSSGVGASASSGGASSPEWKAMEMGPDAAKTARFLSTGVRNFNDGQKRSGFKPVDVAGKAPVFVGYSVLAYAKTPKGYDTTQIQVFGGTVTAGLTVGSPLKKENVFISGGTPSLYPKPLDPPTADGKDAVAKALAFMRTEFPDREWQAGLWGHVFAYDLGGDWLVIGMAHDGQASVATGPAVK
jgi:hypothetical protein